MRSMQVPALSGFPSPFPGRFSHLPALRMQWFGGRDGLALATMVCASHQSLVLIERPARRKRQSHQLAVNHQTA